MKICVVGLWHLGTVTAACLTSVGHEIAGLDFDMNVVRNLQSGKLPIFEPGLEDLVKAGLKSGKLTFTNDTGALSDAQILCVAYDTPVNDNDEANVGFV